MIMRKPSIGVCSVFGLSSSDNVNYAGADSWMRIDHEGRVLEGKLYSFLERY
jgi:hypothetical protein